MWNNLYEIKFKDYQWAPILGTYLPSALRAFPLRECLYLENNVMS